MASKEQTVAEIAATLRECEFSEEVIAKVTSQTLDPEKAVDLAVQLTEQQKTFPKVSGDMKMVFCVRTDLDLDKRSLFEAVSTAGLLKSYQMFSNCRVDERQRIDNLGRSRSDEGCPSSSERPNTDCLD